MKLWLVRHAAPEVAQGTCYGRSDVPALPGPTLQAAQALAEELPQGLSLACSPLQRCEQLRQAACGLRPDLPPRTDPRLAEMDFGAWEGLAWDRIGEQEMAAWTADFWRHAPGGGESVRDFMERVAAAFDETVRAGQDTAWITHAGVIRAALLLARGERVVREAAQWPRDTLPFGGWRLLEV